MFFFCLCFCHSQWAKLWQVSYNCDINIILLIFPPNLDMFSDFLLFGFTAHHNPDIAKKANAWKNKYDLSFHNHLRENQFAVGAQNQTSLELS